MDVCHLYHAFVGGAWREPAEEHVEALFDADFQGAVLLGLVGPGEEREKCVELFQNAFPATCIVAAVDEGFEHVTVNVAGLIAQSMDGAIMYAHTKGAVDTSPFRATWRRSMTRHVISGWERCRDLIGQGHDAVGCHWLTPQEYPQFAATEFPNGIPFFGGNYWMAHTRYLAGLAPPDPLDRFSAERWIGQNDPAVYDLLEGWPSWDAFKRGGTLPVTA